MAFSYYDRLSARQQRVYRQSDRIAAISLGRADELHSTVAKVRQMLDDADRVGTQRACRQLALEMTERLGAPPVRVTVLAKRPSADWGELHGLYEPAEGRRRAHISVWMRTAKRRQVVAFRTFLRTLLHELCHHLDYELLGLAESFHTEGFYKRESSLFHQLVADEPRALP